MKITCSKGTGMQLQQAVERALGNRSNIDSSIDVDSYVDTQGHMGEPGDTWTRQELRDYWDREQLNDPSMSGYSSYEDWESDTLSYMEPITSIMNSAETNGQEVNNDYFSDLAAAITTEFEANYPGVASDIEVSSDSSGVSIRYNYPDDENFDEGYIQSDEMSGDIEADAHDFAEEFYTNLNFEGDVSAATNTSNIATNPIMSSQSLLPEWMVPYYDVFTDEDIASELGEDLDEVQSWKADNLEAYDATHVAWLKAKPEYEDTFDAYADIELVKENGQVFPSTIAGGELFDVSDEIQDVIKYLNEE